MLRIDIKPWLIPAAALYFCDVTILTVGFGDFFPDNDLGRGLVFPYSVGGIIILGLVVSSIAKFAQQLGHDKVVKKHLEKRRVKTLSKTVTSSQEAEERYALEKAVSKKGKLGSRPAISAPFNPTKRTVAFESPETPDLRSLKSPNTFRSAYSRSSTLTSPKSTLSWASSVSDRVTHPGRHVHHSAVSRGIKRMGTMRRITSKTTKLKMLRDERDRFNAMRKIQYNTKKYKKYLGLSMSLAACEQCSYLQYSAMLIFSSSHRLVYRCSRFRRGGRKPLLRIFVLLLRLAADRRLW